MRLAKTGWDMWPSPFGGGLFFAFERFNYD